MNAFPLSGEEACCLSLSVIPLVCAEREGDGRLKTQSSGNDGVNLATAIVPISVGNMQFTTLACSLWLIARVLLYNCAKELYES